MRRVAGFTLIEIILVISIMSVLSVMMLPLYRSFQVQNDLDIAANTTVQSLRRAQQSAQAIDGDTGWGVIIQTGSITLYKGSSYADRLTAFDEVTTIPTNIIISGTSEVDFSPFTGYPAAAATITLTGATNSSRTITINSKGIVSY